MKKRIIIFLAVTTILCGCVNDLAFIQGDGDLIKVNLSLSGEITVNEELLTKSGESKALLGIQVYQNGSPYAWGLFDNTNDLSIYLHSGKQYSIKCQYIKNGKEVLYCFNKTTDVNTSTYLLTGYHKIL